MPQDSPPMCCLFPPENYSTQNSPTLEQLQEWGYLWLLMITSIIRMYLRHTQAWFYVPEPLLLAVNKILWAFVRCHHLPFDTVSTDRSDSCGNLQEYWLCLDSEGLGEDLMASSDRMTQCNLRGMENKKLSRHILNGVRKQKGLSTSK